MASKQDRTIVPPTLRTWGVGAAVVFCAASITMLASCGDPGGRPVGIPPRAANDQPSNCPDADAGDASLVGCCLSPWRAHYTNIDEDEYACADACNYLLDQYSGDHDRQPSLLCDDQLDASFTDFANVAPGVQACGAGFETDDLEGCYNKALPPAPSIRRSLLKPARSRQDATVQSDQTLKPWGTEQPAAGQWFGHPTHRTSTDGRLATAGDQWLVAFYPENVDYGSRSHPDGDRPVVGFTGGIHPWARVSPDPSNTRYPRAMLDDNTAASGGHNLDLCSTNGADSTENPRVCTARYASGDADIEGDCYEQTILYSNRGVGPSDDAKRRWELRSLDVVIFVPRGKDAHVPNSRAAGIWYYPKSAITDPARMPNREDYDYGTKIVAHTPAELESTKWSATSVLAQRWDLECTSAKPEPWCAFIDDQRAISPEEDYWLEGFGTWDGITFDQALLEPATTADGMVVVIHNVDGIYYAYNEHGPCDASGWKRFHRLSSAHQDADVNTRYGFARHPIRDTQGQLIPAGDPVLGGYPWVDRRGDNVMFPAAEPLNGYKVRWKDDTSFYGGEDLGDVNVDAFELAEFEHFNAANARGVVVVGSWTQGQEVLVDGGVNLTDWKSPLFNADAATWQLQMYMDEPTEFRNTGTARLSSVENQFNHYDAMAPISPFDVVWTVNSSYDHNTELVFDEYLHEDALVVAHMNAPLREAFIEGDSVYVDDNGFVCPNDDPTSNGCGFGGVPALQNAATMAAAPNLRLLGGAWIPPVAEGGVRGKGVWLDGANDHIEVTGLPGDTEAYYLGLWVDVRRGNLSGPPGAVYSIADAIVTVGDEAVEFFRGDESVHLDAPGLTKGRYAHLGLAIYPSEGDVDVFINGAFTAQANIGMPTLPDTVHVGLHEANPHVNRPVQAWVDELRVYRLREDNRYLEHELEFFCNLALGSLEGLDCTQIDVWAARNPGADGLDSGLDFPSAAYEAMTCGTGAHRNHGAQCDRAANLGLEGNHLVADTPRPSFSGNRFCDTCHEPGHLVPGLDTDVLAAGVGVSSALDTRRQPMVWPRRLFGLLPSVGTAEVLPGAGTGAGPALLDTFLLGATPDQGPRRIEP